MEQILLSGGGGGCLCCYLIASSSIVSREASLNRRIICTRYLTFSHFASYGENCTNAKKKNKKKTRNTSGTRMLETCVLGFYSKNMITNVTTVLRNTNRMQKQNKKRKTVHRIHDENTTTRTVVWWRRRNVHFKHFRLRASHTWA